MAKVCNNCGTNYDDNMMNCPNCGAPAPQMNQQPMGGQPQYQQPMGGQPMPGAKSKMTAGLLGIFLGAYGVHNFYLGNTSKGILQLVLTFATCGVASLWGFIEGILILCGNINTDSQGRPLV